MKRTVYFPTEASKLTEAYQRDLLNQSVNHSKKFQ